MFPLRRLAWLQHHGKPMEDDGFDIIPKAVNLTDATCVATLITEMQQDPDNIGLIIFDTISTCIAGQNENAPEVMSEAISNAYLICTELDCAGLGIHHPGKNGEYRGHSSQLGNVDMMARVIHNSGTTSIHVEKQKDGDRMKFFFTEFVKPLGIYDRNKEQRNALVLLPTDGPSIPNVTSDLMEIANAMELDVALPVSTLAAKLESSFGKRTPATSRIEATIPWGSTKKIRCRHGLVELGRTTGDKNSKPVTIRLIDEGETN
jgi:hypothetical protein